MALVLVVVGLAAAALGVVFWVSHSAVKQPGLFVGGFLCGAIPTTLIAAAIIPSFYVAAIIGAGVGLFISIAATGDS